MLKPQDEDKKLVKQYKKTNKILRKQLQALNEQIDKLIIQKSNRIGLQKNPKVQKQITDTKVIHHQVENLKKRLQHIRHDNQEYKQKVVIDWVEKFKQLQIQLKSKISAKQEITKKIKVYQKRLKQQKSQVNLKKQEDKMLQKIQVANEQLARLKKVQRDLKASIEIQSNVQTKKVDIISKLQNQQQQQLKRSKLVPVKGIVNTKKVGQISQVQWQKLKIQFLQLKQSQQVQQMHLYQQNDRLRKLIKHLNQQLKIKQKRVDVVKKYNTLEPEKKLSNRLERINQRNTIDNDRTQSRRKRGFSNENQKYHSVRYRDRNNSISHDR